MKTLHFEEGNDDQHKPPTLVVHTNTREDAKPSPSEMVEISATVPFEHQVQEGKHK